MDAYCQRQSVIKNRFSSILPMSDFYSMEKDLEILRLPKKSEWKMEIRLMLLSNKLEDQTFSDTFHLSPTFALLISYPFGFVGGLGKLLFSGKYCIKTALKKLNLLKKKKTD